METKLSNAWNKMQDKVESWLDAIISNIPNLIMAIIVFILEIFTKNCHEAVR